MLLMGLLLVLAQQSGVPSRAAGSGGASTQNFSLYGYDFGLIRRCAHTHAETTTVTSGAFDTNIASTVLPTGGALAAVTPTMASKYMRTPHARLPSAAATANASVSFRPSVMWLWRGTSTRLGGFHVWLRWAIETSNGTTSTFAGVRGGTTAALACTSPTATVDSVFMTCLSGAANASICSNDNVSTATCTDLGADFPCTTVPAFYDFMLRAEAGAASIDYTVVNLLSGVTTSGTLTTDLPRTTAFMGWEINACNGANAGTVTLGLAMMCTTER